MANKYSRYQLQPFPSLYVDNKQPEISALLADRYDKNKTSKDLIDRTLSQLELLEGDRSHLERVKMDVKTTLKSHIDQGDWENSSLVVADAANLVESDSGLVAANKSMQNRQAEIQAIREAKLNGIPMLDFGAESRKTHESYYYDEESDTYVTNVYEPQMTKQLDYRTRKEKMIGNIPASQKGNWAGVSTYKANTTAGQVLDQYIEDTSEGQQEFKKLVELDLPQSLPLEERQRLAKNEILKDFKQVAQQQVYAKTTGTPNTGGAGGGQGNGQGIVISSSQDTPINTGFDHLDDKIRGIQEKNIVLLELLEDKNLSPENKSEYERQLTANDDLLQESLRKASKDSPEHEAAYNDYIALSDKFDNLGVDGIKLKSATQYLTLNTNKADTEWEQLLAYTAAGAATGATVGAGFFGIGALPGALIGGGISFFGNLISQTGNLNNVRDLSRSQGKTEYGGPTLGIPFMDDEREQLADELYGGENPNNPAILGGPTINHLNKTLGTNFDESQLEEIMDLTNSYYTFMVDDKGKDKDGNEITRSSGDDLMKSVNERQFSVNQKLMTFDTSAEGKKKRGLLKDYVRDNLSLNNAGIAFDGMSTNDSGEVNQWLEDMGGADNLDIKGILLPNIAANTPLRIQFSNSKDASGQSDRTATITDPAVLNPKGWVYEMLYSKYGQANAAYDELIRQDYDRSGYSNKTVNDYTRDLAGKQTFFNGGGQEETLQYKRYYEDITLKSMLSQQENFNFAEGLYTNPATGRRAIKNNSGQYISFTLDDGSFNNAAWTILSDRPAELAGLRKSMLQMSMQEFSGMTL